MAIYSHHLKICVLCCTTNFSFFFAQRIVRCTLDNPLDIFINTSNSKITNIEKKKKNQQQPNYNS